MKTGLVVALNDMAKTHEMLHTFDGMANIRIILHNGQNVLISNVAEWEGVSLSETVSSDRPSYSRSVSVLPGALEITVSIPEEQMFPHRAALTAIILLVGTFSFLLLLLVGLFVNRLIVKPFAHVITETAGLGGNPTERRISPTGVPDVDRLVDGVNDMVERAFVTQHNIYNLELSQREMQMYLLRNQIDRHFLYNSLISIKTLADHGELEKVEEIAGGIAQLIRYSTSQQQEVNIFDEMEIVLRYIKIQQIRFGDNFTVETDVDDRLCQYGMLKLLVQPLVENAFIHGLEPAREGGLLHIRGYLLDGCAFIEVEDDGTGIPPERLERLQKNLREAATCEIMHGVEGIALINIQKRIQMAYGSQYGLTLRRENGMTLARLCLPLIPVQ
jgi:two-component system sensor histidine kinase YesM